MLKIKLLSYPLNIDQVDELLLFMIYHGIDDIPHLMKCQKDQLMKLEGYGASVEESINIIRQNPQD